jgi:hypothetical protein
MIFNIFAKKIIFQTAFLSVRAVLVALFHALEEASKISLSFSMPFLVFFECDLEQISKFPIIKPNYAINPSFFTSLFTQILRFNKKKLENIFAHFYRVHF